MALRPASPVLGGVMRIEVPPASPVFGGRKLGDPAAPRLPEAAVPEAVLPATPLQLTGTSTLAKAEPA